MNWARLQDKQHNSIALTLPEVFSILSRDEPGRTWVVKNPKTDVGRILASCTYDWYYFNLYFEWLGLWICEEDVERKEQRDSKSVYYAKKIEVTQFGTQMMPILLISRNVCAWNIALRREDGEFNVIPGSILDGRFGAYLSDEDQSAQPFFQPFINLFSKDELMHTLPRNRKQFIDGRYTFKVSLTNKIWRKLTFSAKHTMDDFHQIIIKAFEFDDDHLYSFFMDGEKWSHDCIASPNDDFGHADASKIQIGAVGFITRQKFLYIYDYGDEWTFLIEVDDINENAEQILNPYVQETRGEAPEQYSDFY